MAENSQVFPTDASFDPEFEERYPDVSRARAISGSDDVSGPEASGYEIHLVLQQRGITDPADAEILMQEIFSHRKPVSSYLDPLKPLPAPDQARRTVYEAFQANGRKRAKLAQRALSTWKYCGEAYLILAEEEAPEPALELLRQGLEACRLGLLEEFTTAEIQPFLESAMGQASFSEELLVAKNETDKEIEFWEIFATRGFLRLLCAVARLEAEQGEVDTALPKLRQCLRLNPEDGLGVRFVLAGLLAKQSASGDDSALAELESLISTYSGDHVAHWAYLKAWLAYKSGRESEFEALAKQALAVNGKTFPLLMGIVPAKMLEEAQRQKFWENDTLEEAIDFFQSVGSQIAGEQAFWEKLSETMIGEYQATGFARNSIPDEP